MLDLPYLLVFICTERTSRSRYESWNGLWKDIVLTTSASTSLTKMRSLASASLSWGKGILEISARMSPSHLSFPHSSLAFCAVASAIEGKGKKTRSFRKIPLQHFSHQSQNTLLPLSSASEMPLPSRWGQSSPPLRV